VGQSYSIKGVARELSKEKEIPIPGQLVRTGESYITSIKEEMVMEGEEISEKKAGEDINNEYLRHPNEGRIGNLESFAGLKI